MEKTKFNRTYEILNEVFNAVTHGIGTGLSIAGLVVLLVKGAHLHSSLHIVSYAIYG
ncbi:hemolysin III family protein, partial [Enterococcus faecium]|nr:hemolysin III family protein [Enterococcus faecium]